MKTSIIETQGIFNKSVTQKIAYSVDQISELTTLSKAFLRNEIRAGNLKANRFGRRVLVLAENLREYLNKGAKEEEK